VKKRVLKPKQQLVDNPKKRLDAQQQREQQPSKRSNVPQHNALLRKRLDAQQQSVLAKLNKRAEQQMSAAKPQSLSSNVRLRSVLAK